MAPPAANGQRMYPMSSAWPNGQMRSFTHALPIWTELPSSSRFPARLSTAAPGAGRERFLCREAHLGSFLLWVGPVVRAGSAARGRAVQNRVEGEATTAQRASVAVMTYRSRKGSAEGGAAPYNSRCDLPSQRRWRAARRNVGASARPKRGTSGPLPFSSSSMVAICTRGY